jgi:hypothetical protein
MKEKQTVTTTKIELNEEQYQLILSALNGLGKNINESAQNMFFSANIYEAITKESDKIQILARYLQSEHYTQNQPVMQNKLKNLAKEVKKNQKKAEKQ